MSGLRKGYTGFRAVGAIHVGDRSIDPQRHCSDLKGGGFLETLGSL